MAASTPLYSKTIYLGAFAHSISLSNLEVCSRGAIGVDEKGVIAFVERDLGLDEVLKKHEDWKNSKVESVEDGFFFPGFIGTHSKL
jgi:guanine deaminase